jgi:hypothetical protein
MPEKGTDIYEIQWNGEKGEKLYGRYVISYPFYSKKLDKIENVDSNLPHKIKFTEMKGVSVIAGGSSSGKDPEIKIFRNGKECGEVGATGSGAGNGKICSHNHK